MGKTTWTEEQKSAIESRGLVGGDELLLIESGFLETKVSLSAI